VRRVAVGTSSEAGAVSVRVSVSAHEDDGLGPLGRCGALLFTHLNSFALPGKEDTGKQGSLKLHRKHESDGVTRRGSDLVGRGLSAGLAAGFLRRHQLVHVWHLLPDDLQLHAKAAPALLDFEVLNNSTGLQDMFEIHDGDDDSNQNGDLGFESSASKALSSSSSSSPSSSSSGSCAHLLRASGFVFGVGRRGVGDLPGGCGGAGPAGGPRGGHAQLATPRT